MITGVRGHIPMRRCAACMRSAPKRELVRFTAVPEGVGVRLERDRTGRAPGRGVYVCPSGECFARAVARRAFGRSLRVSGQQLRVDEGLAADLAARAPGGE